MTEDQEHFISEEQALETGTQAFFTAVGEGAKIVVPAVAASAGWQAMLAVTLPLMGLAVAKGAYRLFAPRTALLAKGYTKAFSDDPTRVAEHAERHKDNADYHETMFRAFRAMVDAAEPEVVETLGYMAGVYIIGGKKPDRLFRGMGRLLCDCEQGELERFRSLLRKVHAVQRPGTTWATVQFEPRKLEQASDDDPLDPDLWRTLTTTGATGNVELGHHPEAERLFLLLKRDGLAGTPSALGADDHAWDGGPDGDNTLEVSMVNLTAILALPDPQPGG